MKFVICCCFYFCFYCCAARRKPKTTEYTVKLYAPGSKYPENFTFDYYDNYEANGSDLVNQLFRRRNRDWHYFDFNEIRLDTNDQFLALFERAENERIIRAYEKNLQLTEFYKTNSIYYRLKNGTDSGYVFCFLYSNNLIIFLNLIFFYRLPMVSK